MSSIKEIATRLNLTEATVSYALNGRHNKVSVATRQRVEEMARTLGYAPNPAARTLASGRSGNVIESPEAKANQIGALCDQSEKIVSRPTA